MARNPDVLVVGGGIVGASIAYHLTAAGAGRVMLCEQDRLPGAGATAKSGGILRMHHTNPWQARLAWQSYAVYADWPDVVGGDCGFRRLGFAMVVGAAHRQALEKNVRMLRGLGIPTVTMAPREFAELQPFCSVEGVGAIAFEPFSGYADPALATLAMVQRARERGLMLREGAQITAITHRAGRVTGVLSNFGAIDAGAVVLASSVWAVRLLEELGIAIPVRRRQVSICFLSWAPPAGAPPLCAFLDDTIGTYFRPAPARAVLVGAGAKDADATAAPPVSEEDMRDARARVGARLPTLRDADAVSARAAFDGYTPDKHGIIGPAPGVSGLYLAVGMSGAGFKIAPAVGRAAAAELTSGERAPELAKFRLERFESDGWIRAEHPYEHM